MSRTSRVDDVVEFILSGIESGRFPIGERLPGEDTLAGLADASRLTTREAVSMLAAQHILDPVQGKGTFVNAPETWLSLEALMRMQKGNAAEALLQLVEVRGFLEIGAAERFARNTTPEALEELQKHLADMVDADRMDDVEAIMQADLAFHRVIIEGSGNPFISTAMAPLAKVLVEARRATSEVPLIRQNALHEHARILDAVSRGDAPAAREAMRSHMRQTREDIQRHLGTS